MINIFIIWFKPNQAYESMKGKLSTLQMSVICAIFGILSQFGSISVDKIVSSKPPHDFLVAPVALNASVGAVMGLLGLFLYSYLIYKFAISFGGQGSLVNARLSVVLSCIASSPVVAINFIMRGLLLWALFTGRKFTDDTLWVFGVLQILKFIFSLWVFYVSIRFIQSALKISFWRSLLAAASCAVIYLFAAVPVMMWIIHISSSRMVQ